MSEITLTNPGILAAAIRQATDDWAGCLLPYAESYEPVGDTAIWINMLRQLRASLIPEWTRIGPGVARITLPWGHFLKLLLHAKELLDAQVKSVPPGFGPLQDLQRQVETVNNLIASLQKEGVEPVPFLFNVRPHFEGAVLPTGNTNHSEAPPPPLSGPGPTPKWIAQIQDGKLKEVVMLAWDAAERASQADLPMCSTIMRGMVLEVALVSLLERSLPQSHPRRPRLREDRLDDLIKLAVKEGLISDFEENCAKCGKLARNLVHPYKLMEEKETVQAIPNLAEHMKNWVSTVASKLESGK